MMNKLKVVIKHLWLDASDTRRAIPPDMLQRLAQRVAASEQRHSGQVRICVEASLPTSYLWRLNRQHPISALTRQRAVTMFGKLRVWDTEHNNGVLIYLLLAEHAIEIVADRGVARHVGPPQWQAMLARMGQAFREKRYEDGLTQALEEVSALLVQHFPLTAEAGHRNELPDQPLLQ
ncbi:TPM domain-containing protein [Polaromonas jejuensis]|uniref:TPM domain-containing protein n=1 Tax=Polaromonas jejuensis TaxID=457502 RepID=A0ABW0QEU5_9BURK|nr:TPM domain-containing protein [Polaromonas jejuensis]